MFLHLPSPQHLDILMEKIFSFLYQPVGEINTHWHRTCSFIGEGQIDIVFDRFFKEGIRQ